MVNSLNKRLDRLAQAIEPRQVDLSLHACEYFERAWAAFAQAMTELTGQAIIPGDLKSLVEGITHEPKSKT